MVYSSITGNTEALVGYLYKLFLLHDVKSDLYKAENFPLSFLPSYDAVIVGTYTWGDGEIPDEMRPLYEAFETCEVKHIVTGVIGTGDRFYPYFCGAVDEFRDMLFVQTNLAVTLKVELAPESRDLDKCKKFVALFLKRLNSCH